MPRKKIDWTKEMIDYLLSHYKTDACDDMGRHLGVSAPSVSLQLRRMGIGVGHGGKSTRREWSESELQYLRDHFPHESSVDIADALGVSSQTVRTKAYELGLKKASDYDVRKYYKRYVKSYRHLDEGRSAV